MALDPSDSTDPERADPPALRTTAEWQFLVTLNDRLRPLRNPVEIQGVAARLLGEHLRVNRVVYAEIQGEEFLIGESYARGVAPFVGRGPVTIFGEAVLEMCRRGETIAVNDVRRDPRFSEAERARILAIDVAAFVAVILHKEGRWLAVFGVHNAATRSWKRDEIALIEQTAERSWAAAERAAAADALRTREERLAFLLKLNDALRPLSDPSDVQEAAARLLGVHLQVNRVGYAEIVGREYVIRREYTNGVAPLAGLLPSGSFGAALHDAYRRGDIVVVNDVDTDARFTEAERVTIRGRQMAAFVGVTLVKGGRMVAAFGVNTAAPRAWAPMEVELIRDVAERTWDAVERTRAETTLREREQRLRLALDASAGGSWTWDASTNQVDWDDGFRTRYGFTSEEPPTFEAWLARVYDEDRPQVLCILNEVRTIKDDWDNTFRIVRPDGSLAWIQSRGRADRDINGQVRRITGLDLDITQRRQTEEELQARRDEERDRELHLLLETATQGFLSVDAEGTIVVANRALELMFGWDPGELIGHSVERLMPLILRDLHVRHRAGYFASPYPRLMGGNLDLVGERKDGSTFPIEVTLNHVATPGGGHAFAFVTDITERHRAASALQERTIELERRTAQLSQLASDLTLAEQHAREQLARTLHDGLQQTLVVAAMNLNQQIKSDAERQGPASVELLVKAKNHLDEAIAAARVLSFELYPPFLQRSGLPAALTWLAGWTRNKYGLQVQISADSHANSTRMDVRTLLFESVRELLFNVVKHAEVDQVAVDLRINADGMLCITVADHGIGFDPAGLGDRAKTDQVGWGLFSIRERLTLLGGRFDIESAPGQGTLFRLIAPRGAPSALKDTDDHSTRAAKKQASRHAASPASARALKILIVDDHAAVRTILRRVLQEHPGLRVVGDASNGLDAIKQAHALRPDIVLMDISMPQMDGIEATRRLRAELPLVKVLGLSMQPRTQGPHEIEQAGATGFFTKGVDTQRLIDHLLGIHAAAPDGLPHQPA